MLKSLYLDSRMTALEPVVNEIVDDVVCYSIANAGPFAKNEEKPEAVAKGIFLNIMKSTIEEPRLQAWFLKMGMSKLEGAFNDMKLLKVADEIEAISRNLSIPAPEHPLLNREDLLRRQKTGGKDQVAEAIQRHWDIYKSRSLDQWTEFLGSAEQQLERAKEQVNEVNEERLSMLRLFYHDLALRLTNLSSVSVTYPQYPEFNEEQPKREFGEKPPELKDFALQRFELPDVYDPEEHDQFYRMSRRMRWMVMK